VPQCYVHTSIAFLVNFVAKANTNNTSTRVSNVSRFLRDVSISIFTVMTAMQYVGSH
jgi:hypothetical protein